MANGDKKKKGRKINEETESKVLSSDAGSAVLKSPDVDQVSESFTNLTNSFSSDTDPDQQPETDDFYQIPSLSSIIIQRYEGERCKGQFHGEGVAYFQGGHVYKGMFSEGLMHGYGVYTWADGVKYEGEFESNMLMGRGRYTWRDGSSYEGEVFNAICHGTGTHICANAVVYTGQWHQGRRHGKGTMYYDKDKSSWYKGDWVNNNKEGWGLRCYPSGDIYEGEWRNNVRHGQGTMRWLKLAQQYSGTWQNGVQHGQGAHMWLLRRVHGSQYPQRNEYRGNFVQGQRHGKGTFYYAGGARYDGEWKNNKKHGKGKFTHRNGHVFEGEFADDQMVTPALSGIRPRTPHGAFSQRPSDPTNDLFTLVPDMALNIESLLEKIPQMQGDMERQQVEFVIMRHNATLRSIYSFYSRLGKAQSPDNTFLLTRLQLWRLLKDCNVHHRGITLAQADHFIREDVPPEEIHSPFTAILLRTLLSCLVMVAYHAYHTDMTSTKNILASCFSKLMEDNILPHAKHVKGFLFIHPLRVVVAQNYLERCWEIYQAYCVVKPPPLADQTMTYRHLVWMFKGFDLLDTKLTPVKLLEIITAENINPGNPSYCNLDLEITFLEFFEVLLGCAEVKCQQVVESSQEDRWQSSPEPEAQRDSPVHKASSSSSLQTTSCTSQSISKLQKHLQFSNSEETEAQKNVNTTVKSQTADTERGKVSRRRESFAGETMVSQEPGLEAKLTSNHSHLQRTEESEVEGAQVRGTEAKDSELDLWIQSIHQFFSHVFFPAHDRNKLVISEVEEEKLRQAAQRRIALAKAQERARLREQLVAEEERRQKEEEEVTEKSDEQDDEVSSSSPVHPTPVASNTSISAAPAAKSSTDTASKKMKQMSRALI